MFIDIIESRLKMAKKLGADDTYLIKKDKPEKDTVADIHAIFGEEPNRTIDASGAEASIRLAILVSFKISMRDNILDIYLYNYFICNLYLHILLYRALSGDQIRWSRSFGRTHSSRIKTSTN